MQGTKGTRTMHAKVIFHRALRAVLDADFGE